MTNYVLKKPILLSLYGFPGSGKTNFARQLAQSLGAIHLQSDKVRFDLFEHPRNDQQENDIIAHLMQYMAEEFLKAGKSVIYDADVARSAQRKQIRELASVAKAHPLLVWIQIDLETSFARVSKRDRRKTDDKYSRDLSRAEFDSEASKMQNPGRTEDYVVISGKHNFQTQQNAVIKRLYDVGLMSSNDAYGNVVKPGLVNLIPTSGRVDDTRRNISIR